METSKPITYEYVLRKLDNKLKMKSYMLKVKYGKSLGEKWSLNKEKIQEAKRNNP
jgi:hypothetical protein